MAWTPGELSGLVAAYEDREESEWLRTAWLAAHIGPMVWAKRSYTPLELLGRGAGSPLLRQPDDIEAAFRLLVTAPGTPRH